MAKEQLKGNAFFNAVRQYGRFPYIDRCSRPAAPVVFGRWDVFHGRAVDKVVFMGTASVARH